MFVATILAAGGGALSALLYVSMLIGSPGAMLLVLMAQLPLFLVGLSRSQGAAGTALAGLVGTLAAGLAAGLDAGPWAAVNYGLAEAAPAFLLVRYAALSRHHPDGRLEWYSAGRTMVWLSLYAAVLLLVFTFYFMDRTGGLEGELQRSAAAMFRALGVQPPPEAAGVVNVIVAIMPGLGAASWLLITAANAALAQGLLTRFGRNLRPGPALASFDLPGWLAGAVTLAAAGGLLLSGTPGFLGVNLGLILAIPYFLAGVAFLHALGRRSGASPGLVVLFYLVLGLVILVLSWLAILGIAALGFIDQVAGLRRRLVPPKNGANGSWE